MRIKPINKIASVPLRKEIRGDDEEYIYYYGQITTTLNQEMVDKTNRLLEYYKYSKKNVFIRDLIEEKYNQTFCKEE